MRDRCQCGRRQRGACSEPEEAAERGDQGRSIAVSQRQHQPKTKRVAWQAENIVQADSDVEHVINMEKQQRWYRVLLHNINESTSSSSRRRGTQVIQPVLDQPLQARVPALRENGLFFSFPYVCPEPVLVKCSHLIYV